MTLDDIELFEPGSFSVKGFKAFMGRHSNWTAKEVGALTVSELKIVSEQIGAKLKESAVPKATAAA